MVAETDTIFMISALPKREYGKMVMVSVSDFSFPDVGTFFFFPASMQ